MALSLDITDDIARIEWDDGKANAVNTALIAEMNEALDKAEADAKTTVIVGRAGVFCGGFDLKILQNAAADEVEHLIEQGGELATRLFALPQPVVMVCTGHAIAQGAAFLLAGDVRIGARGNFKIGLNETQIGMTLRHFGPTLAKARLSPSFYTRAAIIGELFDPDTALMAGYLDEIVPPESALDTAMDRAAALAKLPGEAFAANKQLMRSGPIRALNSKAPL